MSRKVYYYLASLRIRCWKSVKSNWQKFKIGIFMGCVDSMIIFVLVINLVDEYLKVNIPKTVHYYKSDHPVPESHL